MPISRYCATQFKPSTVGYIYTLRNPSDGYIFYVGKTGYLYGRFIAHVYNARNMLNDSRCGKKDAYIGEILLKGKKPIMGVIETHPIRTTYDRYYYDYREFYFIKTYLECGWQLTNVRINDILSSEILYKDIITKAKNGGGLKPSDFYFDLDEKGFPIYDLRMIERLGYCFTKDQYASHWSYIIDVEKYKNVKETKLDYVYGDTICEQNRNINYYNALDKEPDTETMFKRFY